VASIGRTEARRAGSAPLKADSGSWLDAAALQHWAEQRTLADLGCGAAANWLSGAENALKRFAPAPGVVLPFE
jgi:hypothetical protein